jgi:O-antigen/teichoic acid export membrane protein
MLESRRVEEKFKILKTSIAVGFLASSAILIGLVIISPYVLGFLGPAYAESKYFLICLAWVPLASLVRSQLGNLLATCNYPNLYAKFNFSGAIIRVLSCLPLISIWGPIGAVVSLFLSELLVILLMLRKAIYLRDSKNEILD